jgi:hypothetical protein
MTPGPTLRLVLGVCPGNGFDGSATRNAITHLAQDRRSRASQWFAIPRKQAPGHYWDRLLAALTIALILWLFAACAAGRPTSLIRLRDDYEVLTAQCEARPAEFCTPVHVTGDPHDEEAWGFRARPAANALWKEPEVLYAVGDRVRCDEVRAMLRTPSEACWGPVYFRRQ